MERRHTRKIPGLEDESHRELMARIEDQYGQNIEVEWRMLLSEVHEAIREAGTSNIKKTRLIDGLANRIGSKFNLPMDSGGTDRGAANRQVILNVLERVLGESS